MGKINLTCAERVIKTDNKDLSYTYYTKNQLGKFNPKILGMGDLSEVSRQVDAVVVVFDLSGFTAFCRQPDPYLVLPRFMTEFLNWLFQKVRYVLKYRDIEKGEALYSQLPFLAKFTGDGIIFIWNTVGMKMVHICNIVISMEQICSAYEKEIYQKMSNMMTDVPSVLKCGIARGSVCSVGNGDDYVGASINIASRIVKLPGLACCFYRKGIEFEEGMSKDVSSTYLVKKVKVRGIGEEELVCVNKQKFERLDAADKEIYKDVRKG